MFEQATARVRGAHKPHERRCQSAAACLALLSSWPVAAWLALAVVRLAKPSEHPFEIVPGSFSFVPSGDQAGAHANWVTSFDFAHEEAARRITMFGISS